MNNWLPDPEQLQWTRDLIRAANDGAVWVMPAIGEFRFDKTNRVLRMTEKFDPCDEELLRRTRITFGFLDWTVSAETEVERPTPSRGRYGAN